MTADMTIIEGLKKLKMIIRRMDKNNENISKYSAQWDNQRLYFGDETLQRAEIRKLIQSNNDLMLQYVELKTRIERTNLNTVVDIGGYALPIASWLIVLRKTGIKMLESYRSMNTDHAGRRVLGDKDSKLIRFYTEEDKNKGLRKWDDLLHGEIEGRLEVVNATTKLL